MLRIGTANVNGIRAAQRRGMGPWLEASGIDILCLQEVRASDDVLTSLMPGWQLAGEACEIKGRAGVAIALREGGGAGELDVEAVRVGLGLSGPVHTGRWVEADLATAIGPLTVVSAYVHSGEVDTPKQEAKYEFLAAMTRRLAELRHDGRAALVAGDFNIAHREVDIKNWKGNLKNAGFLPEERAYLDGWFGEEGPDDGGWADLGRRLGGEGPGPYTWWSWRGKAFDNDSGWRIDYQIATAPLAGRATSARIERAESWDARWSDHAPLVIDFA